MPATSNEINNPPDELNKKSVAHCSTALSAKMINKNSYNAIILSTAIITVFDDLNNPHKIRALLDSASQSNFITADCHRQLGLSKNKFDVSVQRIGTFSHTIKYSTSVSFASLFCETDKITVDALIIDKITNKLPTRFIPRESLEYLKGIPLADENFHIPQKIDMLLGAEIFSLILKPGKISGPPGTPYALNSSLGYIVMGKLCNSFEPTNNNNTDNYNKVFCITSETPLDQLVKKFWSIEEVPTPRFLNKDDEECELQFQKTHKRLSDGRYSVTLLFKNDPSLLGSSRDICKKRFFSLEKRLESNPELKASYHAFMKDYLEQNHMSLSEFSEDSFYLPHHCVIRPESVSTRLRVVFDASAKSSNNTSLNDLLYKGPKLQSDLTEILLRFRLFPVAVSADVRQMYRQIQLNSDERKFQKILWRFSPSSDLLTYTLNTVTFGVKSAPFLAIRVTRQLAVDEGDKYPLAAHAINNDIFMDDLATSVKNDDEAVCLYNQLTNIFNCGGFKIVKWSSNSNNLLSCIPIEDQMPQRKNFEEDFTVKILGLQWHAPSDILTVKVSQTPIVCNKRNILSVLARMYDPLGFISPVTIFAKILIKKLWSLKLEWDAIPPESIVNLWNHFQSELPFISKINIARHIFIDTDMRADLIGFCDASENGYGAVLYVRAYAPNITAKVNILCAKSRVAPMKIVSIPRLELCAAVLMTRLIRFVLSCYKMRFKFENIFAFTDSTTVLQWINSSPARWKIFVAHRVSFIQEELSCKHWFHVSSEENVADGLSRGLLPQALLQTSTWFNGPHWLYEDYTRWPIHSYSIAEDNDTSEERKVTLTLLKQVDNPLIKFSLRFSSYNRLIRSIVFILRFMKKLSRNYLITASDFNYAELYLLRVLQKQVFSEEIEQLKSKGTCSSSIRKLNPFIENELLRVGGRLAHSELEYEKKHPILLPKKNHIVNLLIDHCHRSNFHTGPNLVLSILRQKYWILGGRDAVRSRLGACNICFKIRPKPVFPKMGDLPAVRITQAKPFLHTGVDYAGPFYVSSSRRRGVRPQKAYICIFVCLAVKAIHLEVASDLTTKVFLMAFKRFISRRGPCQTLYSDNGTNFIGARSQLNEIYDLIQSDNYQEEIGTELAGKGIEWKFNPPSAPHFGGLWESNVKAVKTHLQKVTGNQILSYEEFSTVISQIEALLNSRPLCVLSSDPSEPTALTPAHFLNQQQLQQLPAVNFNEDNINRLTRYQLLDHMVQAFWKRWHLEYLHSLQSREKWNTPNNPIQLGSIVLIMKDNSPPLHWPLDIVEKLHPGPDNVTRVVTIRTSKGTFKRPVVKLCPLPNQ